MGILKSLRSLLGAEEDTAPLPHERPGRNDPCWCGSGRKYKKCHLEEDEKKLSGRLAANCASGN